MPEDKKNWKLETEIVNNGLYPIDKNWVNKNDISRSSVFQLDSTEVCKKLLAYNEEGISYSRIFNPTCAVLEQKLAHIEGGAGAVVTCSGMTAIQLLTMTLVCAGEEIVASSSLYGATERMFRGLFNDLGIIVNFADVKKTHSFEAAISPKTRFVYLETIGYPELDVPNIQAIADISHKYKIPLVVDSTFTPPVNYRPIKDGADIVIHSLSKWIGGHGSAVGGVIIDSGKFDWRTSNVPVMKVSDPNNNNIRWAFDVSKECASIAMLLRLRASTMRSMGGYLSPDNAWIIMQGMETLPLRMEKQNSNALAVAKYLKENPKVAFVRYPGLSDDVSHSIAHRQFGSSYGAMVIFTLKDTGKDVKANIEKGNKFIGCLELCGIEKMTGTIRTAFKVIKENGFIQISVGAENIRDILEDMESAFNKVS